MIIIGNILKNMRINANITQKNIGSNLNVAENTISNYERSYSQPDFDTILKIIKLCGYDLKIYDANGKEINLEKYSIDPNI